jgi:hypothetical protein
MRVNRFSTGRQTFGRLSLVAGLLAGALLLAGAGSSRAAAPKYYFELHKVEANIPVNPELKEFAAEALKADLATRSAWQSDLGVGTDRNAIVAALKSKKLNGFDLIVRFVKVNREVKPPAPGSRLNTLSVSVGLAVLGTAIPGEKIAFSGEGDAGAEAGVPEARQDAEANMMFREAIKTAIGQAIDQAVMKLTMPKSAPMNESHRKRK